MKDEIMQNTKKEGYKNFAIVALGWLGDTLLADGVCKNIKKYNPESKITFVALKSFTDVPQLIPEVDEIIAFDKNYTHKGLLGYLKFSKVFKSKKTDVAIILHPNERSILCAKAINAKKIVSLPLKNKLNPLNLLINKKRQYIENEIRNEYKNYYNIKYLNSLKIPTINIKPTFKLPTNINVDIKKFNLPEKYIVISPEGKDDIKNWDYQDLSLFIQHSEIPCVLTGTEKTKKLTKKLQEDGLSFIDLCGKTNIIELALLIKNSYATVSIDTGSMHLAYGLNVETICLFFNEQMTKEWLLTDLPNVHLLLGKKIAKNNQIKTIKAINYKEVLNIIYELGMKNEKI